MGVQTSNQDSRHFTYVPLTSRDDLRSMFFFLAGITRVVRYYGFTALWHGSYNPRQSSDMIVKSHTIYIQPEVSISRSNNIISLNLSRVVKYVCQALIVAQISPFVSMGFFAGNRMIWARRVALEQLVLVQRIFHLLLGVRSISLYSSTIHCLGLAEQINPRTTDSHLSYGELSL